MRIYAHTHVYTYFRKRGQACRYKKKVLGDKNHKNLKFSPKYIGIQIVTTKEKEPGFLEKPAKFPYYCAKQQKMGTKYRVICLVVMK